MSFGAPGDQGLVGAWGGADADRLGVFRPAEGRWYLSGTSLVGVDASAGPVMTFSFGSPGDIALACDPE